MSFYSSYLAEGHKTRFVTNWRHLITDHMGNGKSDRSTRGSKHTAPSEHLIHPCTTTLFSRPGIWIKIEICNWLAGRVLYAIKPDILVPNLKMKTSIRVKTKAYIVLVSYQSGLMLEYVRPSPQEEVLYELSGNHYIGKKERPQQNIYILTIL